VYARTTTVQADPSKIDAGIASVRDDVTPVITGMDGCVGMSLLADRGSSRCIATSSWESEASMRDSADKVRPLRDAAEQAFGASRSTVETWEVAVVHRDHATPDGACARLTWLSGGQDMVDRCIDLYRMVILPQLEEMDGFCSASLMVDRAAGRAVGTTAFDSMGAVMAAREATARIRERVVSELGATVDGIDEMEIAFAHLHVPEMA